MEFVVRGADQSDAAAIAEVHVASWRAAYAHVVPASILDGDEFAESRRTIWKQWRFHPGQRVAVSVDTDEELIVGFAAFGPEREHARVHVGRGELYSFYLHPDVWGSGCASGLIDHVDERLRAEGFEDAVLWVLDDNPRARAFYERHGWEASGATAEFDAFCELRLPEVEYRKQLTSGAVS
jgi:ribosomal protein S18 acetylase RimI-like enzyme